MKFLRLDLRAFGPFADVAIDLSAGQEGLHVVYGPNEAGKTSALRALRQVLYGIPSRTTDDFLHPSRNLRLGATLVRRDGTRLDFVRRKAMKHVLFHADDATPLDAADLARQLGGCDETQFQVMFGIDHEGLVAGGREIVEGRGEVGHVLFSAGAGIADLRKFHKGLEEESQTLFKPAGSNPTINRLTAAINDARRRIRQSQLPSADWVKHDKALRETEERLAQLDTQVDSAVREKARLDRIAAALPVIAQRQSLQLRLAALGDVPPLTADFTENRREALAQRDLATQAVETAAQAVTHLAQQIAELEVPESVLSHAAQIEALFQSLHVYGKAQKDLPGLHAQQQQAEKAAADILNDLRPGLPLTAAAELRLTRRQHIDIQNLANRYEALTRQNRQAHDERTAAQRRLEKARTQLDTLPVPCETTSLKDALRSIQSQGDLDARLTDAKAELLQLQQQAEMECKRLGLWSGPLEELESLCLPGPETIDRYDRQWVEKGTAVGRLEEALHKLEVAQGEIDRQLDQLRLEGEVPSEDELTAARTLRDQGWRAVLGAWRGEAAGGPVAEEFLARLEAGLDLVGAYEEVVRRADALADRLRREAARVANYAAIQAARISNQQNRETLSEQLTQAQEARQAMERAWTELWQPMGIAPLPPREMKAWCTLERAMVERVETLRQRKASCHQLAGKIADSQKRLAAALATVGHPSTAEPTLGTLCRTAESVLGRLETAAESQRQLARDIATMAENCHDAQERVDRAAAELAEWQAQWAAIIQRLNLGDDVTPAGMNEVLSQTTELFERLKQADGFRERIEQIAVDARQFHDESKRLVHLVDPALLAGSLEPVEIAETMWARLGPATADRKKLDLLQSQKDEQEKARNRAQEQVKVMTARLVGLCREAGCSEVDELPKVEHASAEAADLCERLTASEEDLARLSGGMAIDAFLADAATVHVDELPVQQQRLAEELAELERQRRVLLETKGGERAELATMAPTAEAAEAAEELQNLLAEIEPCVAQYVRLRLASIVLRDGIERYRKQNEGPVLQRASQLFRRLTLSSFQGLQIDFDTKGEQALAGVRPGGESVLPTGMSDGTSDQLYLALRLASLETWLERNEPLPFVVDDILVSFDDARAAATLEVLGELSEKTQVIFFTHHEHLLRLAESAVGKDHLFVHRLNRVDGRSNLAP